jgi:hypothetical protein
MQMPDLENKKICYAFGSNSSFEKVSFRQQVIIQPAMVWSNLSYAATLRSAQVEYIAISMVSKQNTATIMTLL